MVRVLSFFADATKGLQTFHGYNKKTHNSMGTQWCSCTIVRLCVFYMDPDTGRYCDNHCSDKMLLKRHN